MNYIGANYYDENTRKINNKGDLKWSEVEYIEIPVTRILDSYGNGASVIDATVANVTKRGSKNVNTYEQQQQYE